MNKMSKVLLKSSQQYYFIHTEITMLNWSQNITLHSLLDVIQLKNLLKADDFRKVHKY